MTEPTPRDRPRLRTTVRVLLVPVLLTLVVGAAAGGPGWIRVKRGDTLSELALKHHTTVAALRALNKLPGNNLIIEGQLLRVGVIPAVPKKAAAAKPGSMRRIEVTYVVRNGDGVYRIANHFHANPTWLAKRNGLKKGWMVHPGQRLVVGSVLVRVAPVVDRRLGPRVPKAYVKKLIIRTARQNGVEPALALALALNESG
jgi:LysM repeat protein